MGYKCYAPNCKSGYASCKDKVALFKVPSDPVRLELWRRKVPRSDRLLQPSDRICAKHFDSKFICDRYHAEHEGHVLLDAKKSKPRLSNDAIPTIFEGCPSYLSFALPKERKRTKRHLPPDVSKTRSKRRLFASNSPPPTGATSSPADNVGCGPVICQQGSAESAVEDTQADVSDFASEPCALAAHISQKPGDVKLPGPSWNHLEVRGFGVHRMTFVKMTLACDKTTPVTLKHVDVDPGDATEPFKVFILQRQVPISELPQGPLQQVHNIEDFESILQAAESIQACLGGPPAGEFPNISPECASVDFMGVWRHRRCQVFAQDGLKCTNCQSLYRTLSVHAARKSKQKGSKRVRLVLTPRKKAKVEVLRRAKISSYKAKLWMKKRLEALRKEVRDCAAKMKALQATCVEELLRKLPEEQAIVVRECLEASRKAPKGRRYSEGFILTCLLLQIRSPSTYNFMRDNKMLPLPSVTTIRRYIGMVGLKCGFDRKFFEAFRKKMEHKADMNRHGMLIFDEIQVPVAPCF